MKGFLQLLTILMFVTFLSLTGCAQTPVNPSLRPLRIPNGDSDAVITFVRGKLDHVTPLVSKRRGEVFRWKVAPPSYSVKICIKDKRDNPVPFTEPDWNDDRCITRAGTDKDISGTIDNGLAIPNGVRIIEYSVQDKDGNYIIDPDILVY